MLKGIARTFFIFAALFSLYIGLPLDAFGQEKTEKMAGKSKEFCSSWNNSYNGRVGFNEIREFKLPASGRIEIDGGKNGGISLKGAEVSEVTVKACVNAWAATDEAAQAVGRNITISSSGSIRAENSSDDSNWGVSFQVTVPRNYNANLTATNGGISIYGVDGDLEFTTLNGGISLKEVSGNVRGRTTNGGLNVKLTGTSWKGSGLDVVTTNGGVNLSMPEGYAANVETGTVHGGYKSDFPSLNVERIEKWKAVRVNAPLNGGGAPIKVFTTNGGVNINVYGPDAK